MNDGNRIDNKKIYFKNFISEIIKDIKYEFSKSFVQVTKWWILTDFKLQIFMVFTEHVGKPTNFISLSK